MAVKYMRVQCVDCGRRVPLPSARYVVVLGMRVWYCHGCFPRGERSGGRR
jgi:hypothetical protein